MVKRLNADGVAKQVIEAGQPVVNVDNAAAKVKQPALPVQKPLPGPLAKALGQS
jgi:hypothetical protein